MEDHAGSDLKPYPVLSRGRIAAIRFSPLLRSGLKFRKQFERAKREAGPVAFEWYRYDSFSSLFYLQHLLNSSSLSLEEIAGGDPILDVGAGDGALSFFPESLAVESDPATAAGHSRMFLFLQSTCLVN